MLIAPQGLKSECKDLDLLTSGIFSSGHLLLLQILEFSGCVIVL